MSEDTSLTTGAPWHGTQMKPDIFEPVTAEWAGRAAKNTCYLFQRQQQTLFCDGYDRGYTINVSDPVAWVVAFSRQFWMNEVFGTLALRYYFNRDLTSYAVVAGTFKVGHGADRVTVGTFDGTYTTGGMKTGWMYLADDWYKEHGCYDYGQLTIRAYIVPVESGVPASIRFTYLSLAGWPRS
jgi:hypothetical protein